MIVFNKEMKICLILIIILGLSLSSAQALDVTATNGSAVAIQAAINQVAAAGGGTVYIPEGEWNFVEVGEPWRTVTIPAGVNISGAPTERTSGYPEPQNGMSPNDQVVEWKTVLKLPWDVPGSWTGDDNPPPRGGGPITPIWFQIQGDGVTSQNFSDIKLVGYRSIDPSSKYVLRGISVNNVPDFRIDHCYFEHICGGAILVSGANSRGVIDHSYFVNEHFHVEPTWYLCTVGYGIFPSSGSNWDSIDEVLGKYTDRSLFIEDCYFTKWRHCVSSGQGHAHYIFRHSTIENDPAMGSIDAHGADFTGTRAVEVYNNEFLDALFGWSRTVSQHRGGAGVYFNNYATPNTCPSGTPSGTICGYSYLAELKNDGNIELYNTHDVYFWNNAGATAVSAHSGATEDDYQILDPAPTGPPYRLPGPTYEGLPYIDYTPYDYPHPLTLDGTTTSTSTSTSTTSTTTTIPPGYMTVSGKLRSATGTIEANITMYNQDTNEINKSQMTTDGGYSLTVWPDVYDLQYKILNFFIKLISFDIFSNLQNVVNYVTISEDKVSFTVDINGDQEIQVYSHEKPKTVKANVTEMEEVSSLSELTTNKWFYDSTEKKLYLVTTPTLPTTTTATTSTTGTTAPSTSTSTTSTSSTTSTTTTTPSGEKTFGNTHVGDELSSNPPTYLSACKFTAPDDGTITKITAYIWQRSGASNAKVAIYADNSGVPGNLLAESSNEVAIPATGDWEDFTISLPITKDTDYWFALFAGDGVRYVYDLGSPNQLSYTWGNSYPTFPYTFDENYGPSYHNWSASIYATYT